MPKWSAVNFCMRHNKVKTIACAQCPIACEQMSMVKFGPMGWGDDRYRV